jgi:hypothetical protein
MLRGRRFAGAVAEEALELEEVLLVEVIAEPRHDDSDRTDEDATANDRNRLGVSVDVQKRLFLYNRRVCLR